MDENCAYRACAVGACPWLFFLVLLIIKRNRIIQSGSEIRAEGSHHGSHEMDGTSWVPADTAGAWRRRQIAPMPDCRNELLILLIKIMGPAELQKLEIAYIVFIHDDSLE